MPRRSWRRATKSSYTTPYVSTSDYEQVRSDGATFLVSPSQLHVDSEIEDIEQRSENDWVVKKRGVAADLVRRIDSRVVALRGPGHASATSRAPVPAERASSRPDPRRAWLTRAGRAVPLRARRLKCASANVHVQRREVFTRKTSRFVARFQVEGRQKPLADVGARGRFVCTTGARTRHLSNSARPREYAAPK